MAKHFRIVEGLHPDTGEPVNLVLSTSEIDELDILFDIKPEPGQVYNGRYHVTRVSSIRGAMPNDAEYVKKVSHVDDVPSPLISIIDLETSTNNRVSPSEFAKMLGQSWTTEDVPETEKTKRGNAALLKLGKTLAIERDPKYKEAPESNKIKRSKEKKSKKFSEK